MTFFPLLARNLRFLRQHEQRSLSWVATKAGMSKTYLHELEQDSAGHKSPSAWTVFCLAQVFAVPLEHLLLHDLENDALRGMK